MVELIVQIPFDFISANGQAQYVPRIVAQKRRLECGIEFQRMITDFDFHLIKIETFRN